MDWQDHRDLVETMYVDYLAAVDKDESDCRHPHCDEWVLHAPGECIHCDKYPKRQELRNTYGINFTGDTTEPPRPWACPAEMARPLEKIELWYGNVPKD